MIETIEHLPIASLVLDAGTMIRAAVDEERVERYAERLDAIFAPDNPMPRANRLEVMRVEGVGDVITDGFHRSAGCVRRGRDVVPCLVRHGTLVDAITAAVEANSYHGGSLTLADARRAADKLLDLAPELSDNEIARRSGLGSHNTVGRMRAAKKVERAERVDTLGRLYPAQRGAGDDDADTGAANPHACSETVEESTGATRGHNDHASHVLQERESAAYEADRTPDDGDGDGDDEAVAPPDWPGLGPPPRPKEDEYGLLSDQAGTPDELLEFARAVFGRGIALDPCSQPVFQRHVQAERYFTKADNGLAQPWEAENVWVNPPYSGDNPQLWGRYVVAEYTSTRAGEVMIELNAKPWTQWWDELMDVCACLVVAGRRPHRRPDTGELHQGTGWCGTALFYLGPHLTRFIRLGRELGRIYVPVGDSTLTSGRKPAGFCKARGCFQPSTSGDWCAACKQVVGRRDRAWRGRLRELATITVAAGKQLELSSLTVRAKAPSRKAAAKLLVDEGFVEGAAAKRLREQVREGA